MGNLCACLSPEPVKKKIRPVKRLPSHPATSSGSARWSRVRSSSTKSGGSKYDDALIREHALAAAILFQQHNGSTPFDRSASLRYPNGAAAAASSKRQSLPRSSSSRSRLLTDPLLQPHQLVNQDIKIDDLETNHFVLVHGGGFGAWCWYKTIALLQEGGFKVTAVDLTGSGIHSFDTNSITSLSQYVKPLMEFLETLSDGEKVILVGHDFGGACISYAMELFPCKISKAVFVAAVMLVNGQNTLDVLLKQDIKIDDLETNHFVLVHGGGFGAWCWYKTIALLQEGGFKVTAVDLTGSGIHSFDTNSITSLSQYVKPLMEFLETLSDGEKVILVGHDFGGACISYAMELFPCKISKAVFVAAVMLVNGQNTLDVLLKQGGSNDIVQRAQKFLYGNGNGLPPTAIELEKSLLRDLLFNHSPTKDIALASVSVRPIPFAPLLERLSLSDAKYGSVRRFYVETLEDNAIPITLQEAIVNSGPPERVFHLKGADHSPFFSKPQALHKVLVEISKISSE